MRKFSVLILVLLAFPVINAQKGSPMLSNFTPSRNIENQSWAICQDNNLVMLFANRKGILTFDGEEWQTIKIPAIPYSIQRNPNDGKIYIGGDNTFGYLTYNETGGYRYVSLPGDSMPAGMITRIIFDGKAAWFYGDQTILRYNLETGKKDLRLDSKTGNPFSGMMVTPKNTFINVSGKGLFRLESDTLFPLVTGYLTENSAILFSLPYNQNMVLVGLSDGSLSLFDGIKYYNYQVKDSSYLKNNIISEGIPLGDTAYAFSTLDGGAEVVDKVSGKVLYCINNQSELPDDEVFAIGSDKSGGLWLSHQFGLTRVDLSLPVRNYSVFPGLKGNLSSTLRYKNELYASSSEGIYYLTEVRKYEGYDVFVKSKVQVEAKPEVINDEATQQQQNSRKSIFAKIFGKKPVKQEVVYVEAPQPKEVEKVVKKRLNRLASVNISWLKVEGISEKCRQMIATPWGILAATNRGLFLINEHKASCLITNRYINSITSIPEGNKYYVAANDGYFIIKYKDGKWLTEVPDPEFVSPVYTVFPSGDNTTWIGCDNMTCRVVQDSRTDKLQYFTYTTKKEFPERYFVEHVNDTIFLLTESGIHYYDPGADRFRLYFKSSADTIASGEILLPQSNLCIYRRGGNWYSIGHDNPGMIRELSMLKIFDEVVSVNFEKSNLWLIDDNNKLYCIDRLQSTRMNPGTTVFIKSISNDRGTSFNLGDVEFDRGDNVINFKIIAPEYLKQSTTQYQYTINKVMNGWSQWNANTSYSRTIPRQGEYVLKVRARDLWGNISETRSVKFTMKAPFTKTPAFYVLAGLAFLLLAGFIMWFRERQLHNQNRILEQKVRERTAEIEAQKKEITASIEYASRIQLAMLPIDEHFKSSFTDYFIYFKPRDIVSGDFYWIGENDKAIYFTVADCTGHGVPGAFMSTMGISTLHEIISNNKDLKANAILNMLRVKIMGTLHQTGKVGEAADGMDIALCVMSKDKTKLEYSGAFNSLFIFQEGEMKEYKADRRPIGIHYGAEIPFTNYEINVKRGDTLYLFTDGFNDQFGGPDGSKYLKSNFKKLLSEIYYRPMIEQRNILDTEYNNWKGNNPQIDDITIMGIRI